MKKILFLILSSVFIFSACSRNEPEVFNVDDSNVAFDTRFVARFDETKGIVKVPVILAGVSGGSEVTVTFLVDTVGLENPAEENVDFEILNRSITFTEGYGIDSVSIKVIDNDVFSGDKSFYLKIESVTPTLKENVAISKLVTIIDDEHPLASIFGTYEAADYKLADGTVDGGYYNVSFSAVPGRTDQVQISNLWDGGYTIIADVNLDENIISILKGQIVYVHSSYGNVLAVAIDLDAGTYDTEAPITGVISNGGTITLSAWSPRVIDVGSFANYSKTEMIKQ